MNSLCESDNHDARAPEDSIKPSPSGHPPLPSSGWKPPSHPWGSTDSAIETDRGQYGESTNINTAVEVQQNLGTFQPEVVPGLAPVTLISSVGQAPQGCAGAPFSQPPWTCTTALPPSTEPPQLAFISPQPQPPLLPTYNPPLFVINTDIQPPPPAPPAPKMKVLLQGDPPKMKDIPIPIYKEGESKKVSECPDAWEDFLLLKKTTEDSVSRMTSFYDQIVKLQLTHDQEAIAYREAAEGTINHLRKSLESLSLDHKNALSNNENLQILATKNAEKIMSYEKSNYDLTMRLKEVEQRCVHMEDRAKIAETGWKMVEIRQRELETSLDHTVSLVKKLREQLSEASEDKARALQAQYVVYEENRQSVINFYNEREKEMVHEFNESVIRIQEIMEYSMKEREEHLSKCWQDTMHKCQRQHEDVTRELDLLRQKQAKELEANVLQIEKDKERWYDHYRNEMTLLEQRHKEREQHVLADIARRERELCEREERMRLHRLQEEQDAKVAQIAKEAELKGYYQRIVEDINLSFDKEREKLNASHREQLQEISQLHLNNERELERMHREKEREMAQRYRIAGYEVDDRKSQVNLQGVAIQTQSAFLSKFDAIEARQKERAEKARLALQASTGNPVNSE